MRLVDQLRLDVIQAAAEASISLVFTMVYGTHDLRFVDAVREAVGDRGGRVVFVQVVAAPRILLERVRDPSRSEHRKLRDPAILEALLKGGDFDARIPYEPHLSLDSGLVSPDDAAVTIIERFALDRGA